MLKMMWFAASSLLSRCSATPVSMPALLGFSGSNVSLHYVHHEFGRSHAMCSVLKWAAPEPLE